ncbi:probable LRR receptor-like serine/threonine-protein kinase At3g47570 [Cornus florida]|uniref:probable LRR receptor-like serine/threonine-protein kinase At3g47570 n=1 Tax=Cornus florida TaxID=4283 RepID=UPI002897ED4C|nr:probable LRR receptor-like serine/threonine-protein kinase At3g47570 [Cornus florida]
MGNFFNGSISLSLSSLRGLLDLDLSRNNLTGQIPSFFDQFSMKNLNLSFNDFEGEVPMGGVFANASLISVVGNYRLCRGIPALQLTQMQCQRIKDMEKTRNAQPSRSLLKESLVQVSYDRLLKATDRFSSENLVGVGSYGSVYKGILNQDDAIVAIEVLNLQHRGASKSFSAECEAMRNIRHRNFITNYDLKPSIILIDGDMVAHVGDFGLARFLQESEIQNQSSTVGVRGTVGCTAAEYGLGCEVSTKGDVYSYGILVLEMMTGKKPVDSVFKEGLDLHTFARMALPDHVMEIVDPTLLEECLISMIRIGVACSMESPHNQMDITYVIHELNSVKNILQGIRRGPKA